MAAKSGKFTLPDHVKQELQMLVAIVCREAVTQGDSKTDEAQWEAMERSYHGSAEVVSKLKEFLNGQDCFEPCFQKIDIQNNREGNELRGGTSYMLELKSVFHCVPSKIPAITTLHTAVN